MVLQLTLGIVLSAALSAHRPAPRGIPRTGAATLVVGLGAIGPLLLYMLDYDVPLPVDNVWVIVLAALGLALSGLRRRTPGAVPALTSPDRLPARTSSVRLLILPAVVLAVIGLVPSTTSTTGSDVPARAADEPLTLVDWNLHYGVSPLTAVDLEGIAATIEAEDPDVVTLQEVQRGWVFGGGSDMATWLAHRLGHDHPLRARGGPPVRQRGPGALGADRRRRPPPPVRRRPAEPLRPVDHADHGRRHAAARDVDPHAAPRVEHADPAGAAGGAGRGGAGRHRPRSSPATSTPSRAGRRSSCWRPRAGSRPTTRCSRHRPIDPAYKIDWVFGQGVTFLQATAAITPLSDHRPLVAEFTVDD